MASARNAPFWGQHWPKRRNGAALASSIETGRQGGGSSLGGEVEDARALGVLECDRHNDLVAVAKRLRLMHGQPV